MHHIYRESEVTIVAAAAIGLTVVSTALVWIGSRLTSNSQMINISYGALSSIPGAKSDTPRGTSEDGLCKAILRNDVSSSQNIKLYMIAIHGG